MIEKNIRLEPHHSRDLLVGRRSDNKRPKYQPPGGGDRGMTSGGGGPGPGGQGARGQATQNPGTTGKTGKTGTGETAKEKAIRTAAKTVKTKAPTKDRPTSFKGPVVDTKLDDDWGFQDKKAKPKVSKTPKKAAGPFDYLQKTKPKTETTTIHGKDDQVFTITKPKKYSPTYYQDRSKIGGETWGERAIKDVHGGFFDSGLGKVIKTIAPFAIPALLPTKLATPYKIAKLGLDIKNKEGIVGQAINQALTSNLTSNLTSKSNIKNLGNKIKGSGFRDELTTLGKQDIENWERKQDWKDIKTNVSGGGDGPDPEPTNVIQASIEKFQPTDQQTAQMDEIRRKMMILQGYADKGQLNEQGMNTLTQLNQLISQYQADPGSIFQ